MPATPPDASVVTRLAGLAVAAVKAACTLTIAAGSGLLTAVIDSHVVSTTWAATDGATGTTLAAAIDAALTGTANATDDAAGVITVEATTAGKAGNAIAVAVAGTGLTASGPTLVGGLDAQTLTRGSTAYTAAVRATGSIVLSGASGTVGAIVNGVTVTRAWAVSDDATAAALSADVNAALPGVAFSIYTAGGTVPVSAQTAGAAGNAITLVAVGTGVTVSGPALTGGTDAASVTTPANLFHGPPRPHGEGCPIAAVFCLATGGPISDALLNGGTTSHNLATVQVTVRSAPGDFAGGQALARAILDRLDAAALTGWARTEVREPDPTHIGTDANGCELFTLNVELESVD